MKLLIPILMGYYFESNLIYLLTIIFLLDQKTKQKNQGQKIANALSQNILFSNKMG